MCRCDVSASDQPYTQCSEPSRALMGTAGGSAQSGPRPAAFSILSGSQRTAVRARTEYHERGYTSTLGAR